MDVDTMVGHRKALPSNAGPIRLLGFWLEFNSVLFAKFDSSLFKVPPDTTLITEPIDTQN